MDIRYSTYVLAYLLGFVNIMIIVYTVYILILYKGTHVCMVCRMVLGSAALLVPWPVLCGPTHTAKGPVPSFGYALMDIK